MLHQLLVKHLKSSSLETLAEAQALRDILRFIVVVLIVTYSVFATQVACQRCEVPYDMLAWGFTGAYICRGLMLVYNGFYDFHLLADAAREVRAYQEALDQKRMFDNAVEFLYKGSQRTYAFVIDLFLWTSTMAFAVLGSLWVIDHTCEPICVQTFHIYSYLLIAVFALEGASLFTKLAMVYYERVTCIDGFFRLVALVSELQMKQQADQSKETAALLTAP